MEERCCPKKNREGEYGGEQTNTPKGVCSFSFAEQPPNNAVISVAVAQALRELPAVQDFLVRYPGVPPSALAVTTGFPAWLRVQHFLNLLFMAFIIRSGIQVLADHPRLYWKRDCTPGTEWYRFQKAVPSGRIWTAKDDW